MVRFMVIDENKLCYINDEFESHWPIILSADPVRGALERWGTIPPPIDPKRIRPATRADFVDYCCSQADIDNYATHPERYEYPAA